MCGKNENEKKTTNALHKVKMAIFLEVLSFLFNSFTVSQLMVLDSTMQKKQQACHKTGREVCQWQHPWWNDHHGGHWALCTLFIVRAADAIEEAWQVFSQFVHFVSYSICTTSLQMWPSNVWYRKQAACCKSELWGYTVVQPHGTHQCSEVQNGCHSTSHWEPEIPVPMMETRIPEWKM
jgi:hypothetical protein